MGANKMAEHVNHMLIVLGAGMTGLGGLSGRPAFDAAENPGGVRPSFYTRPGIADRFSRASADDRCYPFEVGRSHWIFGGDSSVHRLLRSIEVLFADRSKFRYEALISALPLNRTIEMAGLHVPAKPDPSPSVLMLNIGVTKGPRCPEDHWVYAPISKAAFHRAGFYRNADTSFPPKSSEEVANT